MAYKRILFGTDGSASAQEAGAVAAALAKAGSAHLIVACAFDKPTDAEQTVSTAMEQAKAAGARHVQGEVPTDVLLREGDPATQILAAADEVGAGLIIVGNKGMVGAKGFLLGSVPQEVCERATRDVLVARTVTQVVSELAPGEGGIIERAGEKLAVYVNPGGEIQVMSARCTHMGCTVAWNPGERTFDCPCHGSRFGPTGDVVNGPAARSLPPA